MAGYDKTLDKKLFSEEIDCFGGKLEVSVHSYNEGEAKLQINRQREDRNEPGKMQWAKLGRMTKKEITDILPLIERALENM